MPKLTVVHHPSRSALYLDGNLINEDSDLLALLFNEQTYKKIKHIFEAIDYELDEDQEDLVFPPLLKDL